MYNFISKYLSIEHVFFLYIIFGSVKLVGYPLIAIFITISGFILFANFYAIQEVIRNHSLILIFWILTFLIAVLRGFHHDYRVLLILIQLVFIFIITAHISLINFSNINFHRFSAWSFIGVLAFCLAYLLFAYINNGDNQENIIGSSALASYAFCIIGFWYLIWIYNTKDSILLLIFSFGIFSFLFGHLDSRYWFILIFFVPLIIFFTPKNFIEFKKRIFLALFSFVFGISLFFAGNYTVTSIANHQKLNINTVLYKLKNPFLQAKNYFVDHNFNSYEGLNSLLDGNNQAVDNKFNSNDRLNPLLDGNNQAVKHNTIKDSSLSSCNIANQIELISMGKSARTHDTERFIEPIIGFLMWYESGLENFLIGNGLYSSKVEMLSCMSLYYTLVNKKIYNNIGIFRGNTATTFLYEFGILGLLCLLFSILSLRRLFSSYPVLILVFLLLIFQVFLTSIYYSFSFLFPFYLFILKGGYASKSAR